MEGDRGKYTKDPVKVRFTTKADGRKSISFEIYQNGKRTYERLPDLFLLVETDGMKDRDKILKAVQLVHIK